jgi:hypothetical protein
MRSSVGYHCEDPSRTCGGDPAREGTDGAAKDCGYGPLECDVRGEYHAGQSRGAKVRASTVVSGGAGGARVVLVVRGATNVRACGGHERRLHFAALAGSITPPASL